MRTHTGQDQAIREVIARCLYGADINPMAVEMCKLSLWLVSMDKTKPFSFVDDKIFCGNSLLGVTNLDQLRYLHIYPDPKRMDTQLLVDIDGKIAEATRLAKGARLAGRGARSDAVDTRQARAARATPRGDSRTAAHRRRRHRRGAAARWEAGRQLDDAYKVLSWESPRPSRATDPKGDRSELESRIEHGLTPTVETDYERWQPLHWVIEAPDVFVERGGFDAIIGNPPFLGGQEAHWRDGQKSAMARQCCGRWTARKRGLGRVLLPARSRC